MPIASPSGVAATVIGANKLVYAVNVIVSPLRFNEPEISRSPRCALSSPPQSEAVGASSPLATSSMSLTMNVPTFTSPTKVSSMGNSSIPPRHAA